MTRDIPVNIKPLLEEIALSEDEYNVITDRLGRQPNILELGMFGSMWSEHCGYKHSKPLLRNFPTKADWVLLAGGGENAGAVDIGGGLAVVFKIESHNHPSAVEPFQGAATGVGGIVRDILAMGARPVALLNSLRFGPLEDTHNQHLMDGVVAGISWYGNCIGVPDVGGEVKFSKSYSGNPLVNAMCVGLVPIDQLMTASCGESGNIFLLVGSETGRDGIHGASGLASRTFENDREMRPTVQVGDPFTGKLLIEACLEAAATGCLEGMQDLGAAGLTSSIVESASRGKAGFTLDITKVHKRETEMNPYEVMLSESQERMLLITQTHNKENVAKIFRKWGLPIVQIGSVDPDNEAKIFEDSEKVASIPVPLLTAAPTYWVRGKRSSPLDKMVSGNTGKAYVRPMTPEQALVTLLTSPNIASKHSIYQQFDHHVQTNTMLGPGADAAVIRIKGTSKALAMCTDGNGRYCYLDPYKGGAIAVAEACRNLVCVGARPLAISDCLNFGNPERPEVYFQLEWCIKGMARACHVLGVPVVSGNVSLYNESQGNAIYPTPVVGALGLLEDSMLSATPAFKREGDTVALLGAKWVASRPSQLAGSEYSEIVLGRVQGKPSINLALEAAVQKVCRLSIEQNILQSAHDCSDGGLAVALAECCIPNGMGFEGQFDVGRPWDAALYGEAQSRIIVSLDPGHFATLQYIASLENVPITTLGTISGNRFKVQNLIDLPMAEITDAWTNGVDSARSRETKMGTMHTRS
jgi:phosphoribosylformylglycinamidine synthase II